MCLGNHAALVRPMVVLVSGATFTGATVFMQRAGTNVPVTMEAQAQGYGDNTVVWVP
jgi:ATP/ADP translocase